MQMSLVTPSTSLPRIRRTRSRCSVLQCVAVCCSVLQCVAVCWSVLQCVATCCVVQWLYLFQEHTAPSHKAHTFMLQCVAVCVAVCCSVCCSVLQGVALCCSGFTCFRSMRHPHTHTCKTRRNKTRFVYPQQHARHCWLYWLYWLDYVTDCTAVLTSFYRLCCLGCQHARRCTTITVLGGSQSQCSL